VVFDLVILEFFLCSIGPEAERAAEWCFLQVFFSVIVEIMLELTKSIAKRLVTVLARWLFPREFPILPATRLVEYGHS